MPERSDSNPDDVGGRAPTVSIGLPVYNGEATLAASLDSVLAQTFPDFELIVCDNASTDGTAEIARDYAKRDERIRYHRADRNLGAAPNFNRSFELARGEYFKWHAADDLVRPSFLEACLPPLREHPEVVVCYPTRTLIRFDGSPLREDPYLLGYRQLPEDGLDDLSVADLLRTHPSRMTLFVFGLIRSSVLAKTALIGAFPSSDVSLVYELRLHGRFAQVPRPLYVQRLHPASAASQSRMTRMGDAAWFGANRGLAVHRPELKLFTEMLAARRRAAARRDDPPDGRGPLVTARELLALGAHVEIRVARSLSLWFRKVRRTLFEWWSRWSESFLAPDAPKLWALRAWRGGAALAQGRFGRVRALVGPGPSEPLLVDALGRILDRGNADSLQCFTAWLTSEDPEVTRIAERTYASASPRARARLAEHLDELGAHRTRAQLDGIAGDGP